ncbi:5' nucleotidase, NT5C type [Rhodococcus sp. RS1C4]|nr:hypothetical protein [Rhodococcus sp. RS1C4]
MSRIGIDLDGVFYDFGAAFRSHLSAEGWDDASFSPQNTWYFYREWGITDQQFVGHCHDAANARTLWNHNQPNAEDLTHLRRLQKQGHTLHVITDRSFGRHPGISHEATARWLAEANFPYDTLTFSRDKTVVRTELMIDDKLSNYDELEQSGCVPVLYDRPWNRDENLVSVDHFGDGQHLDLRRRRVSSIAEFAEFVNQFHAKENAS